MTPRSPLWREFETGEGGFFLRLLRFLVLVGGAFMLVFNGVLELTWPQQAVLGLLMVLLAIWMDRSSTSYLVTLTLMLLSCFSTFRYGFWRLSTVYKFFSDPGISYTALDAFFIGLLVFAELYAFMVLYLGYMQTLWPLRRTPVPLPEDPDTWPEVDLLIPTYNEPLSVVRFTALAAMNIDWPADKLNVYILDDGRREEFRAFAEEAGVGYMTRDDNRHAKAGNINRALKRLNAPYVAIFDADHVPTRSFLQVTMGWFLRDKKLGLLQTPHHFYSSDPFEKNLDQFRTIPNEAELFYGVVQDGNDFWNATFFCGSCAVLRRMALDEIGGIAVETVTEDAHTSLRMQINGWNTAYINIPQAAGLATERLSGHVKQRIRWARGMIQIIRVDNPLLVPGLKLAQRFCYFNAMAHFLYALPRLIFLTAPLIYLILGHTNVPGYWATIFAYALPHLVLSSMTNSRIQGQHRHSFWNEIYETVLAPYILLPTMLALLNPKLGSFNVTAKGGVVNRRFFDSRIALPFMVLLMMNAVGLLCAIPRLSHFPGGSLHWPLNIVARMYDGTHPGTIVMNVVWAIFNIIILSVATAVAWESQQRRQTVRVMMAVPTDVVLADGTILDTITGDLSSGGVLLKLKEEASVKVGDPVKLIFPVLDGDATLPGTVVGADWKELRVQFDALTIQEEEALTMVLYSRADTWLGWGEARETDRPLKSLMHILQLAVRGLSQTLRGPGKKQTVPKGKLATSIAPVLLFALMLGTMRGAQPVRPATGGTTNQTATAATANAGTDTGVLPAKQAGAKAASGNASSQDGTAPSVVLPGAFNPSGDTGVAVRPVPPGEFDNLFTLADVSVPDTIVLRGIDAYHSVHFSVTQTQVVKTAVMRIRYHFSPGLLPELSHLKISLNGTLFYTIPVTRQPTVIGAEANDMTAKEKIASQQTLNVTRNENSELMELSIAIPAELLVHNNELIFEFIGHYALQCEDPSYSTLWSHVDADTSIELSGSLLQLPNNLNLLPLPFYDAAATKHSVVPIVFLSQPSPESMRAAGIVASWLGMLSDYRPVNFPVTFGMIPPGNAIVIARNASEMPAALNVSTTSGPTIAMRTNPVDPYSKVLVITGDTPNDLVVAAEALTLAQNMPEGDQTRFPNFIPPNPRSPDDAPRWLSTEKITTLGDISNTGDLQGDGSVPVGVYSRVPPDLYYGSQQVLAYHMGYRYNGIPLANESSLQVYMNTAYVTSAPMPHTDKASAVESTVVAIPVEDMRPFSNSMMMHFVFQIAKKGHCEDTAPLNLQGAIMKDSYLDIRNIPHWIQLPNLEVFANAGYPFTRKADLTDTAVVLPDTPTADEIEMFLAFMSHFGAQTGYPVTNVSVTNADGMRADAHKDFLVMGTADDQPALAKLNDTLPVQVEAGGLRIQNRQGFFDRMKHAWWKVRSSDHVVSGQLETAGGLPDAMLEGLEWPRGSNHTVVLIVVRDHAEIPIFVKSFLKYSQYSDIGQSVSVLRGERFVSYQIGNDVYHSGSLSPWIRLTMLLSEFPWLVVLSTIILCLLLAVLMHAMLRRRARARLQTLDD